MQASYDSLRGKWLVPIFASLFVGLVNYSANQIPRIGWVISVVLGAPLALGMARFALNISREENFGFEDLFGGFKRFADSLTAYLLVLLFVFVGLILLIIPGIYFALSYSLVFYILSDEPDIKPMNALAKSKEMMEGYKTQMLVLWLQFLGLAILCLLTLGIGFLWLGPFIRVTMARFYDELKEEKFPNYAI